MKNSKIKENLKLINDYKNSAENLLKKFDAKSTFNEKVTKIYNEINNLITIENDNLIKVINLIDEINNYGNLLNIKSNLDNLVSSINSDLITINNFYTLANDFVISNNEDIINLEKINIDASTFFNNSKIAENINSINNLKDSAEKLIKNFDNNSLLNDKVNKIYNDINDIVTNGNELYKNVVNTINDINKIYLNKKNKFLSNEIYDNEKKVKSDEEMLRIIQDKEIMNLKLEQEQEFQLKKNQSNTTLYIIIGVALFLIIIAFFATR
jgi:hypothetical protein